jgi:anti-sigma-K factor RskA
VLIVLLGSISAILWQRLEDRNDELDALQAELAQIEGFDTDEPLIWTPLVSADGSDTVTGWLCRTPDGELAWVVMHSEPLAPEQVMQLWLIDDQPHSAGTFVSDADGRSLTVLLPERPLTDFEMLGITVEPAGGSPAPTSNPFVLTEIS